MGNGVSVKKVKTQNTQLTNPENAASSQLNRSNSAGLLETPRLAAQHLRTTNEELISELSHLREQVGWLESAKLDLEDRTETLTGQCDDLKMRNTEFVSENIKIKTELRKLQSDLGIKTEALDAAQRELYEMKQSAKGRHKQMQKKMAEFKQNLSLQLFELRQENEDLKSMLYSHNSSELQPRTLSSDTRTSSNTGTTSGGSSNGGTDSGIQLISREQTATSSLHTDEVGPMGDVDSNQILNTSQSTLVVRLSSKIDEQQLEIERLKSQISSLAFKSGDA
ncbi:uncharacterized protein LOC142345455 isoform X1 [Convolutriloba macropyga]|uniref:uncharacterized protein LOC142345455 isoform X1 n=1 Tax=Convolutriloba macropyga TaxID=536237 RepID=UPI003F5207A5